MADEHTEVTANDTKASKPPLSDLLVKILAVLTLPLIGWGVKLEVGNAVRDAKIASIEGDISDNKADALEKIRQAKVDLEKESGYLAALQVTVHNAAVEQARLEESLKNANANLQAILDLARRK